ncbi:MAG: SDR family oxidoreductase [Candidatus Pelagadaptatus aseana]|uniref:SDR family NAD(P)-dependent oxidoreductase n=1 Tax=Candidatus Pelagadaptatus aseana TaxID=3120508 RepID=UPI0039B31F55
MSDRFSGKRVLVTCVDRYMGQPIADAFIAEGAEVFTDTSALTTQAQINDLLQRVGEIDVLVANFAEDPNPQSVVAIGDEEIETLFSGMVTPLMRIVRSVVPAFIEQGHGKIVAMTSAAPLRGIAGYSAYCAARGAQNAFVRAVGLEVAAQNIQFNAIAQNFVKNERYFPDEFIESDFFKEKFLPQIPTGKVAEAEETGELALYLASEKCTHMVGQVIPWAGGWSTTTG